MLIKEYIQHSLQKSYPEQELKSLALIVAKDILKLSELDSYTGKYINLSAEKKQLLENTIGRLLRFEPVQYIKGSADFCGLSFQVAPEVLIPRPETEELVELIIKETPPESSILDIGTGSGCIAITLSKRIPETNVQGWDISEEALHIARKNNDNLHANVSFLQKDILNYTAGKEAFDIIVSNPPYIAEQEKSAIHLNVLDWEPPVALFVPDNDPLVFYRQIAESGKSLLTQQGKIYVEINEALGKETVHLFEKKGYQKIRLIKDLFGKDRIVTAQL